MIDTKEIKSIRIPFRRIESDEFLKLSQQAQLFFLYLCIYADKEGRVRNPKALARGLSIPEQTIDELKNQGYIGFLVGETGVEILALSPVDIISMYLESE